MSVDYQVTGSIATLTLTEKVYTVALKDALVAAIDRAEADDTVRAIIVTGGTSVFCAGMDLSPGPATFARRDEPAAARLRDSGGELSLRLYNCNKPLIAAINGAAVGVGITMTLPMDFRIAADTAKFGFVFAQRGIVLESCSSWFLPRLVGISQALDWALSGRVFDAQEALAGGLVNALYPPEQLMTAAVDLAKRITSATAPVSVALNRQLLWRMLGESHPMAAHIAESRAMYLRGISPDCAEGVASFLERRPAKFTETVPHDLPDIFPGRVDPPFTT